MCRPKLEPNVAAARASRYRDALVSAHTGWPRAMWALVVAVGILSVPQNSSAQAGGSAHASSKQLSVGVASGIATPVRRAAEQRNRGATFAPRLEYSLDENIAAVLVLNYSLWGSFMGSSWELSALPGLRWYILDTRPRPWIGAGLGYGQLVHENHFGRGRTDIGLRLAASMGVDFAVSQRLALTSDLSLNRLRGPAYYNTWLGVRVGLAGRLGGRQ